MRAAIPFIQKVLANGRVARKECRVALVANRCRENTNVYHQLTDFLKKVRKAPFISVLRETQNYNKAADRGLGILELAPYLVRRDQDQWQHIIKWLNSKRSQPVNA
jgi:chromosome partitioning protein